MNCVPSTSLTRHDSDLGPESSTMEMDSDDDFKMMSNSSEVKEGMVAAFAVLGSVRSGANSILERNKRL